MTQMLYDGMNNALKSEQLLITKEDSFLQERRILNGEFFVEEYLTKKITY